MKLIIAVISITEPEMLRAIMMGFISLAMNPKYTGWELDPEKGISDEFMHNFKSLLVYNISTK